MIYLFHFHLGDVEDALKKIKKFICSKLAFFQAFIEERLKFTSSLYLMLIWIRVLKFEFENPMEVGKQIRQIPKNADYRQLHRWAC